MTTNYFINKSLFGNAFQKVTMIALFAFVLASCSKKKPDAPDKSNLKELINVEIKKSDNTGYTQDGFVFKRNDNVYVTVPQGADISKVKMDLKISPKATVTFDGRPVANLSGTFDLTETKKIIVTSESGSPRVYHIIAQPGIKEFDQLIYDFKEKFSIPGVSIAISKTSTSEIVYKSGIGHSDVTPLLRTKPNHLFRLGSVSKQFTSIAIMKLIQNGKFTVESKVFGPEGILKDEYSDVSPMAAKVTIRQLLDHTTGWESNPDPMFTTSFKGQTLADRIKYVLKSPQAEPGTKYSYFNMGFGILDKVIEKKSGKKYEVFLKEVLAEANITDIHVGKDLSGRRANEVVYYSQDGYNGYGNEMDVIAAAGGIIASSEQLLKLQTYIDGRSNIPDILTPEIRNLMLTRSGSNTYALGWRMNHRLFPGAWYHGGNLAGTAAFWVMGPEYNTVILCNSRSYLTGFDDELYYISEKMINHAATIF
jgi:CubicO group peptidase (beta-lactamase class C family)